MSPCCLDEVPEQRGHADEGEHHNDQELPHAEVEVPAREVRVDERPEEVVVVIPCAAEDVRLVDHADVDEVLEEEWARRGGKSSAQPAGRSDGVGARCGEAATSKASGDFCR